MSPGTVRHASIELIFVPGDPVEMSYQPSITAGSSDIEFSLISELHARVSETEAADPTAGECCRHNGRQDEGRRGDARGTPAEDRHSLATFFRGP